MKRKLLATAMVIVGALMASAMAAQDTSGMRYTSASEGFYASLRAQFNSGGSDDAGIGIENSSSRFGVRGTNDLGDGWQGFYQYEAGIGLDNGSSLSTRLGHVGVRGGFGQLQVGTFWPQSYNWVHGSTDVANWASGSFIGAMLLPSRQSRALEYTTPDLNGFQAAVFIEMDPNRDGEGALGGEVSTPGVLSDDSTLDHAEIAAVVASLQTVTDPDERTDLLERLVVAPINLVLGNPFASPGNPVTPDSVSPTGTGTVLIAIDSATGNGPLGITLSTFIDPYVSIPAEVLFPDGSMATLYYFDIAPRFVVNPNPPPTSLRIARNDFTVDPGIFGVRSFTPGTTVPRNPKDDNDIDLWSLSSKYSIQGFNAGISYTVAPDGLEKSSGSRKDLSLYALRLGYAQDNWYVSSWYAEDNAGDDTNRAHDTETFSLAAGIAVGKANLYAVYETQESDNYDPDTFTASSGSDEDEVATIGMQYNLGSRSRLWIEYASRDYDSNPDADNYTTIGLRHDL